MKLLSLHHSSAVQSLACATAVLLAACSARADVTLTVLHTFNPGTDGNVPYAALVQGADGNFYGVNTTGGRSSNGTIFRLSPNGANFGVLNTFTQSNQGYAPEGGLVQANDGNFYGTTSEGGGNGYGTVYQVTAPAGKILTLAAFASGDPGGNPVGSLIQGIDGFLYGTAEYGGKDGDGTVFRTDISTGATTALAEIGGGSDGINPESDLIQARDGNFYGTTSQGGTGNLGTFFRLTPAGLYTVLYSFTGSTDGGTPLRGVIQGNDGAFYGIANAGGTGGAGVIYKITVSGTTGTLTTVYAFQPGSGDGTNAIGQLIQASDGNFYGTTSQGGTSGDGTIYRVTPSGGFLTLFNFADGNDSGDPIGGLTQGIDGKLYGTTAGESDSNGIVFSIDLSLAPPTPQLNLFTPTSAAAGNTVSIVGEHLVGTTGVNFAGANGARVPASSFSVVSGTYLSAVVPNGATTGVISATANGINAQTAAELTVTAGSTPPPPNATRTVINVTASDPVAAFLGNNQGRFKITRTSSDISKPLTVLFGPGGSTAVRGVDYEFTTEGETLAKVTNSITIPAHELSVGLKVVPIENSATSRSDRVVILRLKAGVSYKLGALVRAKVSIAGYSD